MDIRRGITQAVDFVLDRLKKNSRTITSKEEIAQVSNNEHKWELGIATAISPAQIET